MNHNYIVDRYDEPKPAEDFQIKYESEDIKSESEGGSKKYPYGSLPNFLIFVVDDMGSQDLGCFGNKTISTPHIDKMRAEGALLEHHLSAAPICTPSRAAFLTGRYAKRWVDTSYLKYDSSKSINNKCLHYMIFDTHFKPFYHVCAPIFKLKLCGVNL